MCDAQSRKMGVALLYVHLSLPIPLYGSFLSVMAVLWICFMLVVSAAFHVVTRCYQLAA